MEPLTVEADLDRLRRSAQAYLVIAGWAAAGVFDALAAGRAPEVDARALALTAPILVHVGLVRADGAGWALTDAGRGLHGRGALAPIGPGMLFGADALTAMLLGGARPITTSIGVMPDDPEATRLFLERLWHRAGEAAETVAALIAARVAPGAAVVDVGGGHGRYALALARRGLAATLVDLEPSIRVAADRCGDAVTLRTGDFLVDPLGGPYQAALLSNIVHGLDDETNRRLLGRVAAALAPGGLVAIKELVLDDDRAGPEAAALFNIPMLMATAAGRSYTGGEIDALAAAAGLAPAGRHDDPALHFAVLLYRRGDG
jgi:SAM-dependent methyltransferase